MAKSSQSEGFAPVVEETEEADIQSAIPLEKLKIDKVELRDLGNTLPIGIFLPDGERLQNFTLRPYTTEFDLQLSRLYRTAKQKLPQILGQFLPKIIETIGGIPITDIAAKSHTSPQRLIENMYLADALALVLAIRQNSVGSDIAITANCPACRTKNDDNPEKGRPYHDIETVEVNIIRHLPHKPLVEIELHDALEVFDEKIKRIHMQPMRLYQIDKIVGGDNAEDVAMLYYMIAAFPESTVYNNVRGQIFDDDLYLQLSNHDLNRVMRKAMNKLSSLGPDMTIEMVCRACGNEWDEALPWGNLRQFLFVPADTPT